MRRSAMVLALLALLFLAGRPPSVGAQIPVTPPPIEDVVDDVVHTVEETVETVEEEVVHTGEEIVHSAEEVPPSTAPAVEEQTVSAGAGGGGPSVVQPGGSATGDHVQVAGGSGGRTDPGAGEDGSSPGSLGGRVEGSGRTPRGEEGVPGLPEEFVAVVAAPVRVVKTNDADGDSSYSDAETTPVPGSDVSFTMSVVNQGTETVTIIRTSDFFPGPEGVADREVCRGLVGRTLASGASVNCRFTLGSYAPPMGGSKVNTVSLQMLAGGGEDPSAQRTLFATDASTVRTGEADVLGLVVRDPGRGLAGTGAAVWRWGAVAVLLGAVGIEFLRLGRARARGPAHRPGSSAG
jgi:hypothetical protein